MAASSSTTIACNLARAAVLPSPSAVLPSLPVTQPAATVICAVAARGGSVAILAVAAVMSRSSPATALVDERMSTEGTGLGLGVSNNLLVWILVGVFALVWSFYVVYTSTLDEDDDSALSL